MKKLKQEYLDFIDATVAKHKDEKGPVILMLHDIQNELGYIHLKPWIRLRLVAMFLFKSLWRCYFLCAIHN